MTQLSDKDVDQLIKNAIRNEVENSAPPMSADEAWEQLSSKLNGQHPRSNRVPFFKRKLFYAVAIIFISLIILLSPQTGVAYSKLIEVFQNVQENVTHLFIKVGDDGSPSNVQPPETDDADIYIVEDEFGSFELSLEDAQVETAFMIKQPKVIPEGYTLQNVTVIKSETEKSDDIYLNYESSEGSFNINQRLVDESFGVGVTVDNDDTQIDSVDIHGYPGSLFQYKDNFLELIWVTESHYYSISGMLSRDEIIEISESM